MKTRRYKVAVASLLTLSMMLGTGCGSKQKEYENVFSKTGGKESTSTDSEDVEESSTNNARMENFGTEKKESGEKLSNQSKDIRDYYDEYTWQGAYFNILEAGKFKDPESESMEVELTDDWTYDLIYVDQDNVPELLISSNSYYAYVASFQCGETVISGAYYTGTWGNDTNYVPGEDLLCSMSYEYVGEEEVWYYEYSHLISTEAIDQNSIKYDAYDWKNITNGGVSTKEEIITKIQDTFIDINELKIEEKVDMVVLDSSDEALFIEKFSDGLTYDDIAGYEFEFASGAGGWCTYFYLKADGSFWGEYCDDNMGSDGEYNGEAYFGERYLCDFTGKFGSLTKVDDYTYKTTITELNFEKTPDTQEIVEGTLVKYTDVYGFENHKDMYFYLPGKPLKDLDERFLGWVHLCYESNTDLALNMVCLNNEAEQEGFSGYNEVNYLFKWLNYKDESDLSYQEKLNDAGTDLSLKVETAEDLYETWDSYLNDIWNVLLAVKSTEEMNTLKEEERQWISKKEKTLEFAGQNITDESEKAMVMNMVGANLTRERCLYLLTLLQDRLD